METNKDEIPFRETSELIQTSLPGTQILFEIKTGDGALAKGLQVPQNYKIVPGSVVSTSQKTIILAIQRESEGPWQ